jgi:alginate O-acetyltransferase complex protein AlgI
MVFASFEFLFLFLPVFFAAYLLTPSAWRNVTILVFSWGFYGWWRVDFLALLAGVTLFTFLVARAMGSCHDTPRGRRLMVFGVAVNLAVLGYFKYANFGVQTFNDLVGLAGQPGIGWAEIVLPVWLSFYVLQSVSYLVDIRRGEVVPTGRFLDYAAYKALFSQLIAGPVVRYSDIAAELRQRSHSLVDFGAGARRFMIGFAMKVVLADTLSPVVDAAFAIERPGAADAWIGAIAYTMQLFFDFAGYSLMAIGLGLMVGFHFPRNFDNPYLAGSIQQFWQRWHMTLSRFLRDYLYIPLGGSRLGRSRTYVNLLATMAIGGFWHGASWNFIVWGVWHGALLALHRAWTTRAPSAADRQAAAGFERRRDERRDAFPAPLPAGTERRRDADRRRSTPRIPWVVGHLATLLCVVLGWVMFRAADLGTAFGLYAGMAGLHGLALSDELAWQLTPDRLWTLPLAAGFVYLPLAQAAWVRRFGGLDIAAPGLAGWLARAGWLAWPLAAFLFAMVLLYSRAAVPFLYFQF